MKAHRRWIAAVAIGLAASAPAVAPASNEDKHRLCEVQDIVEVTDADACGTREETVSKALSCRDKSFGIEDWNFSEEITDKSGWKDGGYSQGAWCSQVVEDFFSNRPTIGPEYDKKVIHSDEDARWTDFGRRQYNYECTVLIRWGPIYNEMAKGNICGEKAETQVVPKTCKVMCVDS